MIVFHCRNSRFISSLPSRLAVLAHGSETEYSPFFLAQTWIRFRQIEADNQYSFGGSIHTRRRRRKQIVSNTIQDGLERLLLIWLGNYAEWWQDWNGVNKYLKTEYNFGVGPRLRMHNRSRLLQKQEENYLVAELLTLMNKKNLLLQQQSSLLACS